MENRRGSDDHFRRLKLPPDQSQPPPQQPPQKCPRCESINTKFCYYNNYSLSQPRFFCKTCRRYWTQGGTLRNVPVGGGCRKGKRAKPSPLIGESSPNLGSRSEPSAPQIQLGHSSLGIPMPSSRYGGGGFLPSLAAMQSFSQTPPLPPQQHFNTTYNTAANQESISGVGSQFGSSSSSLNLDLLRGFNSSSATTTADHSQQEAQFYQLDQNPFEIQPNKHLTNLWSQTQLLNSTTANPNNYWSSTAATASSATNDAAAASSTGGGSSSLNPTPWPDLPADHHYGNPP